jgi:hypothetical protein
MSRGRRASSRIWGVERMRNCRTSRPRKSMERRFGSRSYPSAKALVSTGLLAWAGGRPKSRTASRTAPSVSGGPSSGRTSRRRRRTRPGPARSAASRRGTSCLKFNPAARVRPVFSRITRLVVSLTPSPRHASRRRRPDRSDLTPSSPRAGAGPRTCSTSSRPRRRRARR